MKRAVGYFRVSTKKEEQKQSLVNQKEMFLNAIKERGYTLHSWYIDEKTGTTAKRPNFLKMLEDAEKGLFDVIIVKELSRLARNMEVASMVKRFTETHNVRIISLDGQIDTFDPEKNRNFGLYAWLYQNESAQISSRIKSVFKARQGNGEFLGSLPPYGYRIENRKLVPRGDETADVIKLIYAKYLEGWGQDKIARHLSKEGYKTPSQLSGKRDAGRLWHGSTVKKILVNPHYLGHLVQHRETTFDVVNKKRRQVPKDEQIWVRDTHPALIDETTYNLVQQKVEGKKKNGKVKRYLDNRHLLTGFLYCADCGAPLWYRSNRQGYICGAYAKHGKVACTHHAIREDHLIAIIKKDLKTYLSVDYDKLKLEQKIAKTSKKIDNNIQKLHETIENLTLKNKKYLDSLIDGYISESDYQTYTLMNNKEIEKIQIEIEDLKVLRDKKKPDISAIRSELIKIANLEVIDRELLNMLIDRIEIKETGELKVSYTFSSPVQEYNYKRVKAI